MLRSTQELEKFAIRATDGPIGQIRDLYFDDESWIVRYVVADTGTLFSGRKVLISPIAITDSSSAEQLLSVSITKEQIRNSPDIDTDKPVSRQHEINYLGYYGFPYYWGGVGFWGANAYPSMMMPGYSGFNSMPHALPPEVQKAYAQVETERHQHDDPHLRSCNEVKSYHIHATDGEIGHVSGMLIDEETWAIRYMIIDTSNWWLGHQVIIAPQWIRDVSWSENTVTVGLTRKEIQEAPVYSSAAKLNRNDEMNIYKHYRRSGYWGTGKRSSKNAEPA